MIGVEPRVSEIKLSLVTQEGVNQFDYRYKRTIKIRKSQGIIIKSPWVTG